MKTLSDSFVTLLQIAKTRTTPHHPSSNVLVEYYDRTTLQTIRCFLKSKQQDCDLWLHKAIREIRATPNMQADFSPNIMMFGREAFQPLYVTLGTLKIDPPKKEVSQYIRDLVNNRGKIHKTTRENLKAKQERQKDLYYLKNYQKLIHCRRSGIQTK